MRRDRILCLLLALTLTLSGCAAAAAATAAEAAEMPAERLPLNKRIGNASLKRSGRIPLRAFYTGVQTWENLTAYCLPVILTIPS